MTHAADTTANSTNKSDVDRRSFLKTTSTAVVAGSVAATVAGARNVHAQEGKSELNVGLIGTGGRGLGAAQNAINAHPKNRLFAMCDVFEDRMNLHKDRLRAKMKDQYKVDDDHYFSGFDGYKKLIASDVDVVLLCTPPAFRPEHLRACIEAGKHVFCEKPVAVDGPGVRHVMESCKMAKERGLSIVSGLCWRYDLRVQEVIKRLQDGEIGDIVATHETYLTNPLWHRGRKEMWTEMDYQMRNWLYFTWLSGDHIVEQHIHSLDKSLWLKGDKTPVSCVSLGGRQTRVEEQWGHIYDHFATTYEWEDGTKTFSHCRQQPNCFNETQDHIIGTKGRARILDWKIEPNDGMAWQYEGKVPSMYDFEHVKLFEAIRAGMPINNGEYMCNSTLMAIMGREAAYTGQKITSEQMLNSKKKLGPEKMEWGDIEVPTIARPGITNFS